MPATPTPVAPRMKAPTMPGLARTRVSPDGGHGTPAFHKGADRRIVATVAQAPGRAVRDGALGFRIKEDAIVADREQARQLMGHNDDGRPKTLAELQDQVVQATRRDRI